MWCALPHPSDLVPRTFYLTPFAVAVQTPSVVVAKKKRGRSGQFQIGPASCPAFSKLRLKRRAW